MNRKTGFTLVELLVVIAIIALLIGLLLPALAKARANAQSLKDKTQITQIHKAALGFAAENKGYLPTPGLINRKADPSLGQSPSLGPENAEKNFTAHLYSAMIAQNLFKPDLLIGTTEVNAKIKLKEDYNYGAYQPGQDVYWDGDTAGDAAPPNQNFLADLTNGSNVSYSHAALCGQRKKIRWRDTQEASFAAFGTRGTGGGIGGFGGGAPGTPDYDKSPTLQLHGPKQQWNGHVVFNDNHAETLTDFYAALCVYMPVNTWTPRKDNIYQAEFSDYTGGGQASNDSYMGMFTAVTATTATPTFDPLIP